MTTGRINQVTTFASGRDLLQRKKFTTNSKVMLAFYESLGPVRLSLIQADMLYYLHQLRHIPLQSY